MKIDLKIVGGIVLAGSLIVVSAVAINSKIKLSNIENADEILEKIENAESKITAAENKADDILKEAEKEAAYRIEAAKTEEKSAKEALDKLVETKETYKQEVRFEVIADVRTEFEERLANVEGKEIELERIKSEERIAKAKYQAEVDQTKAKLKAEKEEADAARKHEKDLAAYEAKRIAEVEHLTNRLANTAATAYKQKLIYGGYKDE